MQNALNLSPERITLFNSVRPIATEKAIKYENRLKFT